MMFFSFFQWKHRSGDWSVSNMRVLNVSNSVLMSPNKYTTMVLQLTKLHGLVTLNVSGTGFNATSLEIVVEYLHDLENLDISCTKVGDIACLKRLQDRLRNLNLHGLNFSPNSEVLNDAVHILSDMKKLQFLDISDEKDLQHPFDMLNSNQGKIPAIQFLKSSIHKLPLLTSLDLSGKAISVQS